MQTWIVTGGAGFIGSNFVRLALARTASRIVVYDKLTYAGSLASLAEVRDDPRLVFVQGDIADRQAVGRLLEVHQPEVVVNFAAESHVDRSIDDPGAFIETNIRGTWVLLEESRRMLAGRAASERESFRFLQVSTDEVYGSLGEEGAFSETTPYAPNSPYAASKAAADHIVRSYQRTFGLGAVITNCSNNYGPFQFPEKLIPLMILNALDARALPIYGDGGNVRDWLYVEDHCEGLLRVIEAGRPGEKYNLGGNCELTNLELVDHLCAILDRLRPPEANPHMRERGLGSYAELKTFVADRPGHDRRYAIDASKARRELGWMPRNDFETGLLRTVEWYLGNRAWCRAVQADNYDRQRLGLDHDTVRS